MVALATIQEGNKCTEETKAKADVFLHQHIDEMLEFEYSNCDDPSTLWKDLEIRFNNQREVLLPSSRDEWNNLRFQDFKKVNEYTSALFRICRTLRFCGQTVTEGDMLEKTFSTFHASNINLHVCTYCTTTTHKNGWRKETSSIIRYVEPLTGDVFTARFADCHFNEAIFPPLGGEKKTQKKDVSLSEPSLLYLDPRTKQSETKVQKIMHLQEIANQLPDAFTDTKRVTKSHIRAVNAPARVELPNKQAGNNIAQESQKRLKRKRPIGSKDKNPRKRKGTEKNLDHDENVLDETQDTKTSPEEEMNDMNKEMSINYSQTNILWDRNEIGDINEIFSYSVASNIVGQSFGHHKGACPWLTENHLLSGYVKQGLVNPLAPRKDMVIENQIQLICKVVNHRTDLENIFTKKPYASGLASAYVS
ncbi:hypothetical protein Tco_1400817 [Tanacetum coccineum]